MKKYILFTYSIKGIGGAQIYLLNKLKYLEKNGWEVDIISSNVNSIIFIEQFSRYTNLIFPEINYPINYFNKKRMFTIFKEINSVCFKDEYDELVIESHGINLSTWSEYLASFKKSTHIIYLLTEKNIVRTKSVSNYLLFKYNREELVAISQETLSQVISKIDKPINYLDAKCCNSIVDIESPIISKLKPVDFRIGILSRLDKPYLMHALNCIIDFSIKNPNIHFQLILIGGEDQGLNIDDELILMFADVLNIDLLLTGFLFPIPVKLLTSIDFFINVAGSACLTTSLGIPTIVVDTLDFEPIGILGITTNNIWYRDSESPITYDEILSDVIVNFKKYGDMLSHDGDNYGEVVYDDHLNYLYNTVHEPIYYNVLDIRFSYLRNYIIKYLGLDLYYRLHQCVKYYKRMLKK